MFLLQMWRCTLMLTSPVSTKLPISSIIPPRLSISMPSMKDLGVFAICSTTSAPRPAVSSRTRSKRCSGVVEDTSRTSSAPQRRAQGQPVRAKVTNDDLAGSHHVWFGDVEKAERPGANDYHGVAGVEALHRVGGELLHLVQT